MLPLVQHNKREQTELTVHKVLSEPHEPI